MTLFQASLAAELGLSEAADAAKQFVHLTTMSGASRTRYPIVTLNMRTADEYIASKSALSRKRVSFSDSSPEGRDALAVTVNAAVVPDNIMPTIRGRKMMVLLSHADTRSLNIDQNRLSDDTDKVDFPIARRRSVEPQRGASVVESRETLPAGGTKTMATQQHTDTQVCKDEQRRRRTLIVTETILSYNPERGFVQAIGTDEHPNPDRSDATFETYVDGQELTPSTLPARQALALNTTTTTSGGDEPPFTPFAEALAQQDADRWTGDADPGVLFEEEVARQYAEQRQCSQRRVLATEVALREHYKKVDANEVVKSELTLEQWLERSVYQGLTQQQREEAYSLLLEYHDKGLFSNKPGRIKEPPVRIKWKLDADGVRLIDKLRPEARRRLSPNKIRAQTEWVDQCLALGLGEIVRPEDCSKHVGNPTEVVQNGKLRVCHAIVSVNSLEEDCCHVMPSCDEIQRSCAGHKYYSCVDMCKYFNQRTLHEDDRDYYAVYTPRGIYRSNVLFFGGKTFATSSHELTERMMRQHDAWQEALFAFQDDIIHREDDWSKVIVDMRRMFEILLKYGATVAPLKVKIGFPKLRVLGKDVSEAGISPSDKHVQIIKDTPFPETHKAAVSFAQLAQYYKTSMGKDFATLADTLRTMARPREERVEAFETLRDRLINAPTLVPFDPEVMMVIDTDASDTQAGGVIAHVFNHTFDADGRVQGDERPLAYFSHVFKQSHQSWPIFVKECYAVVMGVDKARHFMAECRLVPIVRTDHAPLLAVAHTRSPMTARWYVQFLMEERFTIEYRPGLSCGNADAMSRMLTVSCSGPARPDTTGIITMVEDLLEHNMLPMAPDGKRYYIYEPKFEGRVTTRIKKEGLAKLVPFSKRATDDADDVGVRILIPDVTNCVEVALAAIESKRHGSPLFVMMPTDMTSRLRASTKLGQERLDAGCTWVYTHPGLCWVIINASFTKDGDKVEDRVVYATQIIDQACDAADAVLPSSGRRALTTKAGSLPRLADVTKEFLTSGAAPRGFVADDDGLLRNARGALFVPPGLRKEVLTRAHTIETHHAGRDVTLNFMRERFAWDGMAAAVRDLVRDCVPCARKNATRSSAQVDKLHRMTGGAVGETYGLDVYGPMSPDKITGHKYVLTMVDLYHSYVEFVPLKTVTSRIVIEQLLAWSARRGTPKKVLLDNHKIFTSDLMQAAAKALDVDLVTTAPYTPEQLGRVEYHHIALGQFWRRLDKRGRENWSKFLPHIAAATNDRLSARHNVSPFMIEFCGRKKYTPLERGLLADPGGDGNVLAQDVAEQAAESQLYSAPEETVHQLLLEFRKARQAWSSVVAAVEKMKQADLDASKISPRPPKWKVGDLVLVYRTTTDADISQKFLSQWRGPFKIVEHVTTNTFRLADALHPSKPDTIASGRNLAAFTASLKAAREDERQRSADDVRYRKEELFGEDTLTDLTDVIKVGGTVAVYDHEVSDMKRDKRYLVGKVVEFDVDEHGNSESLVLHLYGANRTYDPILYLMWLNEDGGFIPSQSRQATKEKGKPWRWYGSPAQVIAAPLTLVERGRTRANRLNVDKSHFLRKRWKATTLRDVADLASSAESE